MVLLKANPSDIENIIAIEGVSGTLVIPKKIKSKAGGIRFGNNEIKTHLHDLKITNNRQSINAKDSQKPVNRLLTTI